MAYDFSGVFGAMKKRPDQEAQQTNLYGNGGSSTGESYTRAQTAGSVPGTEAPSANGAFNGGAQSRGALPSQGGARKAALTKNYGKAAAPVDMNQVSGDIAGKTKAINSEEDAYFANAAHPYEFTGDQKAGIDAMSINSKTKPYDTRPEHMGGEPVDPKYPNGRPPQPGEAGYTYGGNVVKDDFDPNNPSSYLENYSDPTFWAGLLQNNNVPQVNDINLTTSTDVGNANMLDTDAGVQELFHRGGGAEGTRGENAFDTALLRKDTGFQQQRDKIREDYSDLKAREREIKAEAKGGATQRAAKSLNDYKDQVKGYVQGKYDTGKSHATDLEKAYDDAISQEAVNFGAGAKGYANSVLNHLKATKEGLPYADQLDLDKLGVNAGDYYHQTGNKDGTSWKDFLSQNQAGGFENLAKVLGLGESFDTTNSGKLYGHDAHDVQSDQFTFDSDKFKNDVLTKAGSLKKAADAAKVAAAAAAANKGVPGGKPEITSPYAGHTVGGEGPSGGSAQIKDPASIEHTVEGMGSGRTDPLDVAQILGTAINNSPIGQGADAASKVMSFGNPKPKKFKKPF